MPHEEQSPLSAEEATGTEIPVEPVEAPENRSRVQLVRSAVSNMLNSDLVKAMIHANPREIAGSTHFF